MAYYTHTSGGSASLIERALASTAGLLHAAAAHFARYRVYRQTRNELEMLTDRDLNDLGLSRSMISSIAWDAAENHTGT